MLRGRWLLRRLSESERELMMMIWREKTVPSRGMLGVFITYPAATHHGLLSRLAQAPCPCRMGGGITSKTPVLVRPLSLLIDLAFASCSVIAKPMRTLMRTQPKLRARAAVVRRRGQPLSRCRHSLGCAVGHVAATHLSNIVFVLRCPAPVDTTGIGVAHAWLLSVFP